VQVQRGIRVILWQPELFVGALIHGDGADDAAVFLDKPALVAGGDVVRDRLPTGRVLPLGEPARTQPP
jgi:hypothetical protein